MGKIYLNNCMCGTKHYQRRDQQFEAPLQKRSRRDLVSVWDESGIILIPFLGSLHTYIPAEKAPFRRDRIPILIYYCFNRLQPLDDAHVGLSNRHLFSGYCCLLVFDIVVELCF